ncbi:MAG: cation-translocating P-type ATPase [Bacteroidia bacterium]
MKLPFKDRKFIVLITAVIVVVLLEIFSLTGKRIPMPFAPFFYATCILGVGYSVIWNGLKALFKLNFSNINLLMLIAVIGAFYLGEYPEAAVLIVLYILGERLEDIGIDNSKSALDELVNKAPKTAFVKSEQKAQAIEKIAIGTLIEIKPGDMIPLDGEIISGHSSIDEAAITGEPIPKDKHPGDTVFAGTLNKNGFLEIKTSAVSEDTTFSKIVRLTFEAQANKSETQKFIQKFSRTYTPLMIALSVLVFLVSVFILDKTVNTSIEQAITLLVIACPCALVISTPVAIYAALGNASEKGVLIKGGKYLEAIADIKAIALDKTRTLTDGKPVVSDVFPINGCSREELLACSAGAEIFSEHPLADAIVEASRKEGFEPHLAEKFRSVMGEGAIAECLVCEDETIYVGKLEFIEKHHGEDAEAKRLVEQLSNEGKTSVVISFGNGIAGVLGLSDAIKPESMAVIQELKLLCIEPIMLTGDHIKTAEFVAKQIGIVKVYGGLLPEDKAKHVKQILKEKGNTAMLGDGINDAPALANSTVGIAMGASGSDTAIETANIALLNEQLTLIPYLIRLGRATLKRIKLNTGFAIGVKALFVILAFFGYSHLVLAITADVGVTLLVILSSLRLRSFEH